MRASVFQGAGLPLGLIDVPEPRPGPGDLLLKVGFSGVCGTDLHLTQASATSSLAPGAILGHEFSGEVVDKGGASDGKWRVGQKVTVMPYRPCPACGGLCKDGLDIICPKVSYLGIAQPGGNAQFVAVGADQALLLPDNVDLQSGALVEPLAVGRHAVRKAGPLVGLRVLVIGGGPLGLAVLAFARLAGAERIYVSEPRQAARTRALTLGASGVLDPRAGDILSHFADLAGGPPEVIFECVGTPGMIEESVRVAPLFGRVVVVGACMEVDHFRPIVALSKELTLKFVLGHDRSDFEFVLNALAEKLIDSSVFISEICGLEAFSPAFDGLRASADCCKLLLKPN